MTNILYMFIMALLFSAMQLTAIRMEKSFKDPTFTQSLWTLGSFMSFCLVIGSLIPSLFFKLSIS
jgi:hypothetical protein